MQGLSPRAADVHSSSCTSSGRAPGPFTHPTASSHALCLHNLLQERTKLRDSQYPTASHLFPCLPPVRAPHCTSPVCPTFQDPGSTGSYWSAPSRMYWLSSWLLELSPDSWYCRSRLGWPEGCEEGRTLKPGSKTRDTAAFLLPGSGAGSAAPARCPAGAAQPIPIRAAHPLHQLGFTQQLRKIIYISHSCSPTAFLALK